MCGCLIGTLPQIPQQNVFLGLPLELMVEEAALLVEKGKYKPVERSTSAIEYLANYVFLREIGAAYIVDDVAAHKTGLKNMLGLDRQRYLAQREVEMRLQAHLHQVANMDRKAKALEKKGLSHILKKGATASSQGTVTPRGNEEPAEAWPEVESAVDTATSTEEPTPATTEAPTPPSDGARELHPSAPLENTLPSANPTASDPATYYAPQNYPYDVNFHETSTKSSYHYHALPSATITLKHLVPKPPQKCYPTYCHLHSHGYFLSPGLRFGSKYMAYPGDPLRFHSHFTVNGLDWDEEISFLDIVGGGRLGTGVKKGWMVGGKNPDHKDKEDEGDGVRVFSVEWGGF